LSNLGATTCFSSRQKAPRPVGQPHESAKIVCTRRLLDEDFSLERAWSEINQDSGRAASSTVEALAFSLRAGGTALAYVRRANADGAGGDGLIQRFNLIAWPEASSEWENVDRYPDSGVRDAAWNVFTRLAKLNETEAFKLGAMKGPYDKVPFLRFDDAAAAEFLTWREGAPSHYRARGSPRSLAASRPRLRSRSRPTGRPRVLLATARTFGCPP